MRDLNVLEMCAIAGGNGTPSVVVNGKEALERLRAEEAAEAAEFARFMDGLIYEAELREGAAMPASSAESPEPQTSPAIKQAEKEAAADKAIKDAAEQAIKDRVIFDKMKAYFDKQERDRLDALCTKDKIGDIFSALLKGFYGEVPVAGDELKELIPKGKPLTTPLCEKSKAK